MSAGDLIFRITFCVLNFLIGAVGAALIIIGGIFLSMSREFISSITITSFDQFLVSVLFNSSILLIIVGGILLIIAVIGIIGAIKHRICGVVLMLYICIVGVLLVLQIVLVIVIASRNAEAKDFLSNNAPAIFIANLANDTLLQAGLSQVERLLQCCGINDTYRDYTTNGLNISTSCNCNNDTSTCTPLPNSVASFSNGLAYVYPTGCVSAILGHLEDPRFQYGLGAGALAIVVIEILLILFAICMVFLDFKKED